MANLNFGQDVANKDNEETAAQILAKYYLL